MAKSTKSYEERMLEMEKKEQESLEKKKVKNEPIGSVRLAVQWNPFLVHLLRRKTSQS